MASDKKISDLNPYPGAIKPTDTDLFITAREPTTAESFTFNWSLFKTLGNIILLSILLNVLFPVTAPDIAVEVKAAPSKPYDKDTLFASLYVI